MNKQEFLAQLRKGLSGLPKEDIEERLAFYDEMIDDRMEEGLSEEDAVSGIGSVDEIVSQIIADIPLGKLVKEKIAPKKKMRAWEIVLLVLGSPIWLSLLIALMVVVFALFVVLWSVVIVLWVVFAAFIACGLAGIAVGVYNAVGGNALIGMALVSGGLVCLGLAIFMFFGSKAVTKGVSRLSKKLAIRIKNRFRKKEKNNE